MVATKRLTVWILVICAVAGSLEAEPVTDRQLRWAGMITGGVVAAGMLAGTACIHFIPEHEWSRSERVVTYLPMACAAVATSLLTTVAFFDLFLEVPMHPLIGTLAGLGAGALEGAVIGGFTFGSFMATATYFDPTFVSGSSSIYRSGWMGLSGGALFGALTGAIPGAIAGTVLAIIVD